MNPVTFLKPHISLNVHDLDASIDFYRRMFGIEPMKVRPGYAKFDVAAPPLNLALNELAPAAEPRTGALSHLGLQVATSEDVLAMRTRWREAGLDTREEERTDCCYAIQDKVWVNDPDGNEWEAFVVLADSDAAQAASCCTPDRQCAVGA